MGPLAVLVGLLVLIVYATWAAIVGIDFIYTPATGSAGAHYLSPFYSPCLGAVCGAFAIPGVSNLALVNAWPFSPAILILWAPLGLRATCYYYRKAYYRAFLADPPACGVAEPRERYRGETAFPWILQNLHRYFLYPAIIVLAFLWWDTVHAFNFAPHGGWEFGVGLGSLVLLANVVLLTGFTFGCHAFRHLVGGGKDCFSCSPGDRARHGFWRFGSWFNKDHMAWAWLSLFMVAFADLYVRLLAMGVFTEIRLI